MAETKKRGRKAQFQYVFNTLTEALTSPISDGSNSSQPYRVDILNETRFVLATSPGNATRMAAYALGATAKVVSIKEVVKTLTKGIKLI